MKNTRNWIIALLVFYTIVGITICILYLYHDEENNLYSVNRIDPGSIIGTSGIDTLSDSEPSAESIAAESTSTESMPESEVQEASVESESTQESETPIKEYYSFKSINRSQRLNIRKTPGMKGVIIGRILPGASGYILEKGEEWSKVVVNDIVGYANMEYLELTPCEPSDYPAAYQ